MKYYRYNKIKHTIKEPKAQIVDPVTVYPTPNEGMNEIYCIKFFNTKHLKKTYNLIIVRITLQ